MKVTIPESPPFKDQMCQLGNEHWSVARLATLTADFTVLEIPLAAMTLANTQYTECMRGMVMHMKAVLDADMSKPIILDKDGHIMDGRHRLMHCLLNGQETIKAVRFEVNPSPCRIDDE